MCLIFVGFSTSSSEVALLILLFGWLFSPPENRRIAAKRNMSHGFPWHVAISTNPKCFSYLANSAETTQRTRPNDSQQWGGLWWWASTLHAVDASWGSPNRSFRDLWKRSCVIGKEWVIHPMKTFSERKVLAGTLKETFFVFGHRKKSPWRLG